MKKKVFYSFHFDNDFWRTNQIRQIGVIEKDEPVSKNQWEEIQKSSVKKWIDNNLKYKNCTIVLIGSETYKRPWVLYEIKKSWELGIGLFGIYIHNLKDQESRTSYKSLNPFDFVFNNKSEKLSRFINTYDPITYSLEMLYDKELTSSKIVYRFISDNLSKWVDDAIEQRTTFNMFGRNI
jgi:hypothetical protein